MKKILFVLLLMAACSQNILAQLNSKTHTVTLSINNILELDFDNTTQVLGFTFANAADFESGKTNLSAAGLRVRSNKPWTVSVKANTANFGTSVGGDANVSAGTLSVRKNGGTSAIVLTTTDQALATGDRGGFGANTFLIDYLANPGYVTPATYTLGITFTVTAP
jgi:hypothetical protein